MRFPLRNCIQDLPRIALGRILELLRGATDEAPFPNHGSQRKSILFFGGNFITNGITMSFLSLLSELDRSKYRVFLVVDRKQVESDKARIKNLHAARQYCDFIYSKRKSTMDHLEKALFDRLQRADQLNQQEMEILNRAFRREALHLIGNRQFDIAIEFNGYSPYWAFLFANITAGRKVIYQHSDLLAEAKNPHPKRSKPRLNSVFRIYQFYDVVVSVSRDIMNVNAENLREFYGPVTEVTFSRNMIVPDRIRQKSRLPVCLTQNQASALSKTPRSLRFISIGRLSPEKNHSLLIEAFTQVIKAGVDAILYIVGDGPLRAELEQQVKENGIGPQVIFAGVQENPFPLLSMTDCMVFPSAYEGQGLVLLEALVLGVFCIGTDIPPVKAILTDQAGIVVSPTVASLATGMLEFAGNPRKGLFDVEAYAKSAMQDFYVNVCGEQE